MTPSTVLLRWAYALKPASWLKLIMPTLLGQALGAAAARSFSFAALAFGAAFTVLDLAFIVLTNDWGDRNVDAIKRRMFFDRSSPKTIPDGILPAHQVLIGGVVAGALALAIAFMGARLLARPLLGWAGLVCIVLFVAYTLPPVAANYRGWGELLEAIGVGVALPWMNAYAQSGIPLPQGAPALAGFFLLALASAVASGLGDEASDRAGGKSTVVTRLGNRPARLLAEALLVTAAVLWLSLALICPRQIPLVAATPAAGVVLWQYFRVRALSPTATTDAFAAQARYKRALHRGVWCGAGALSLGLLVSRFFVK